MFSLVGLDQKLIKLPGCDGKTYFIKFFPKVKVKFIKKIFFRSDDFIDKEEQEYSYDGKIFWVMNGSLKKALYYNR